MFCTSLRITTHLYSYLYRLKALCLLVFSCFCRLVEVFFNIFLFLPFSLLYIKDCYFTSTSLQNTVKPCVYWCF